MTNVFTIKKADRIGMPTLIGIWGPSGSGKTYSALQIARGLVGEEGKIGLIDTENKRACVYADCVGGWDHLDFQPTFTPDRYVDAFRAFESAGGYGCIIVDSMSHVWNGEGGVLDQAESAMTKDGRKLEGVAKWKAPKTAHIRMMNYLLRSPFHVIFCIRAKSSVTQTGSGKFAKIESNGVIPICEKNFIYEMTVSVLLDQHHMPVFPDGDSPLKCHPLIPSLKAPDGLYQKIFNKNKMLGVETGKEISRWVKSGTEFDATTETLKRDARHAASLGTESYKTFWDSLTRDQKSSIFPIHDDLKRISEDSDREAMAAHENFENDFSNKKEATFL